MYWQVFRHERLGKREGGTRAAIPVESRLADVVEVSRDEPQHGLSRSHQLKQHCAYVGGDPPSELRF